MKSYRPMVHVQGEWVGNSLRFKTEAEAAENVRDLMYRWTLVDDMRVDPSDDEPNYSYLANGTLLKLEDPQ